MNNLEEFYRNKIIEKLNVIENEEVLRKILAVIETHCSLLNEKAV